MQLANGGHLRPLRIDKNDIMELPAANGISLGLKPDFKYDKTDIILSPGEAVLFYSDGVIEAENQDKELFGRKRLIRYTKSSEGPPWSSGLLEYIGQWRGNARISDDITILEIWRDRAGSNQTMS
jgi:sigma-B regulation protein RsbU (phosphoserine phosphatase)